MGSVHEESASENTAEEPKPVAIVTSVKVEESVYGGCDGPNSVYVKLVSSDNHKFIMKRECAMVSGTMKLMLSGPGTIAEDATNEINFREISSHIMVKICQYLNYKWHYARLGSPTIPEFPIQTEMALELLMAANFLDC